MDGNEVVRRANAEVKEWLDRANEYMKLGKNTDAKKMITNGQKAIRAIKAEVVAEEKEVRTSFTDARLKTSQAGQTVGLFMSSKHRGQMSRVRASAKRGLASQQQDTMQVFKSTKAALDDAILQLDKMKLDVDLGRYGDDDVEEVEEEVTAAIEATEAATSTFDPPTPTESRHPKPPTPPQWAPDPHGRHEVRYWDGTQWTEHVANGGVQGVDTPS